MSEPTHIDVEAEVRYWEDATVNDVQDDDGALIPGRVGDLWKVRIDLRSGAIENWLSGTVAQIHYKVCDQGLYWLSDDAGTRVAKWRGDYVPGSFLCHGDQGYGDYIIFKVDGDGTIANFETPEISEEDWTFIENPMMDEGPETGGNPNTDPRP